MKQTMHSNSLSIYIHWPFCLSKCPYCDFNSHVRDRHESKAWTQAIEEELESYANRLEGRRIKTIFFGGGTPSLIPPNLVEKIMKKIFLLWKVDQNVEITLEANPTSSEAEKFENLVKAGINRFSLGIQALDEKDLSFLGREHSAKEALKALEAAQMHAKRVSFDLIYARPGQTLKKWEEELKQALSLGTKHLSLYQLTIEPGTAFYTQYKTGRFQLPKDALAADFYEATEGLMNQKKIHAYEVSNYAMAGQECRHNLAYWSCEDYIGVGPGAHGRISISKENTFCRVATRNHRSPELWIQSVLEKKEGTKEKEFLCKKDQVIEKLMMGFRAVQGVLIKNRELLGKDFCKKLDQLQEEGYLTKVNDTFKPTLQGRLCLNSILNYLVESVPEEESLTGKLFKGSCLTSL